MRDLEIALVLAREMKAAAARSADASLRLDQLQEVFGVEELDNAERARIQTALQMAGLEPFPSLLEADPAEPIRFGAAKTPAAAAAPTAQGAAPPEEAPPEEAPPEPPAETPPTFPTVGQFARSKFGRSRRARRGDHADHAPSPPVEPPADEPLAEEPLAEEPLAEDLLPPAEEPLYHHGDALADEAGLPGEHFAEPDDTAYVNGAAPVEEIDEHPDADATQVHEWVTDDDEPDTDEHDAVTDATALHEQVTDAPAEASEHEPAGVDEHGQEEGEPEQHEHHDLDAGDRDATVVSWSHPAKPDEDDHEIAEPELEEHDHDDPETDEDALDEHDHEAADAESAEAAYAAEAETYGAESAEAEAPAPPPTDEREFIPLVPPEEVQRDPEPAYATAAAHTEEPARATPRSEDVVAALLPAVAIPVIVTSIAGWKFGLPFVALSVIATGWLLSRRQPADGKKRGLLTTLRTSPAAATVLKTTAVVTVLSVVASIVLASAGKDSSSSSSNSNSNSGSDAAKPAEKPPAAAKPATTTPEKPATQEKKKPKKKEPAPDPGTEGLVRVPPGAPEGTATPGAAPSSGTPSTGTPSTGTPSAGTPSTGTPSTGTTQPTP